MNNKPASLLVICLLGSLFFLALVQLLQFSIQAGRESLQVDFSAYDTAGHALNEHLSPYWNNFAHDPPVWDGVSRSRYSRFLYPPLVAALFQPLAYLPYQTSKIIWELITLASLVTSLYFTARVFMLQKAAQYFLAGILVCVFFPLYTHLERGQIDLITLLCITAALSLLLKRTEGNGLMAGALLAIAVLLKLHCVYLLPFLVIRKRWDVLKGFLYGSILLVFATMLFVGSTSLVDYAVNQFPRIAGITHVDDTLGRTEREQIRELLSSTPEGYTIKDGRTYKTELISFFTDATLVEPLTRGLEELGMNIPRSMISMVLLGIILSWTAWWLREVDTVKATIQDEFLYWQIPLVTILLTAPLTWTMNTVWMLPWAIILVHLFGSAGGRHQVMVPFLPIALGFVLIAIHDDHLWLTLLPRGLWAFKYVIGELLILTGLLFQLRRRITDREALSMDRGMTQRMDPVPMK